MKRDGALHSLWQDTTPGFNGGNSIENKFYDVVIAGGGITGITTGLLLQQAGKSVMIAEAHTIGFGTTGGTTAHLNTMMDTPYNLMQQKFGEKDTQLIADAIARGLALIRNNVESYKIDCGYKELGAYIFSQDDKQSKELEDIFEATRDCGVAVEWSETLPVPIPFEKVLRFPGQATFHPTRYLNALAEKFIEAGGTLVENCRITSVEEGEPHNVTSSRGDCQCRHFVYATHIPPGVNLLHFRCAPYRSYAFAAKLANNTAIKPDALVYDLYDPYHYYRTQEIDGEIYFIAGGEDHKTGNETNTDQCFRKLESYVKNHFELKEITHKWSSQYFEPVDGLPYIGNLPGHEENMLVATGYGGNGMTYSAVAALLLTDMILNRENEYDTIFDPNRIKIVAGFNNFVKESADVVGKFFKKLIPAEKLPDLTSLAHGEARIVKYEGERVAIYKDETGNIYAVSPACTHIKCEVAWNNAERSWDCPCHGSRFSFTGEVLTAPARKDLSPVEILKEEKVH